MKTETVIQALQNTLSKIDRVEVVRNSPIPEVVPADGLIILRDGTPGVPEEVLGGFRNVYYSHTMEIEVYVSHGDSRVREEMWTNLLRSIGSVLEADLTLGGTVAGFSYGQPEPITEPVDGGHDIKQAVINITADYSSDSPLG